MISPGCLNLVLPVVADSWDKLRGCDVLRLLNQIHYVEFDSLQAAADIVRDRRPDLGKWIDSAVAELRTEVE